MWLALLLTTASAQVILDGNHGPPELYVDAGPGQIGAVFGTEGPQRINAGGRSVFIERLFARAPLLPFAVWAEILRVPGEPEIARCQELQAECLAQASPTVWPMNTFEAQRCTESIDPVCAAVPICGPDETRFVAFWRETAESNLGIGTDNLRGVRLVTCDAGRIDVETRFEAGWDVGSQCLRGMSEIVHTYHDPDEDGWPPPEQDEPVPEPVDYFWQDDNTDCEIYGTIPVTILGGEGDIFLANRFEPSEVWYEDTEGFTQVGDAILQRRACDNPLRFDMDDGRCWEFDCGITYAAVSIGDPTLQLAVDTPREVDCE
jgi:hypothetical protein